MKLGIGVVALFVGIVLAVAVWAIPPAATTPDNKGNTVETKGATKIKIDGGRRGLVSFPHRRHQQRLQDCQICHATFEQVADSIKTAKAQNRLAPKQVMKKLCISCHRSQKAKELDAGPTTCSKCHTR